MKPIIKYRIVAVAVLCLITTNQSKKCEASSKTVLFNKIKAKTSES